MAIPPKPKTKQQNPRSIRLPPDLEALIQEAAERNFRSVRNEIGHRLRQSFEQERVASIASAKDAVKSMRPLLRDWKS